ncbi:MAG TPA: cyclin-dependent kinase inhibitor 3 family protein [Stellaceae bacterium]|nr:cyclin-dependent kinase inhibitor 3 family protein [Stellaceae bacterium]
MRTSLTDPLRIAVVSAPGIPGAIGLTLCPGKKDQAGGWNRDLETDLTVIREWGAEIVVTLVEHHEFLLLDVTDLANVVARHGMEWVHLPIRDVSVPGDRFEAQWLTAGAELRKVIRRGGSVLVHCRGGLGRAGMIAARLLVELGMEPEAAIKAVRNARSLQAIETREQEAHVRGCCRVNDLEEA